MDWRQRLQVVREWCQRNDPEYDVRTCTYAGELLWKRDRMSSDERDNTFTVDPNIKAIEFPGQGEAQYVLEHDPRDVSQAARDWERDVVQSSVPGESSLCEHKNLKMIVLIKRDSASRRTHDFAGTNGLWCKDCSKWIGRDSIEYDYVLEP